MKTLDNWLINTIGQIHGKLEDGKQIRTSQVLSRTNDIVITKSGSQYKLLNPCTYQKEISNGDPLVNIDKVLLELAKESE